MSDLSKETLKAIKIAAYRHFFSRLETEEEVEAVIDHLENDPAPSTDAFIVWSPFEKYTAQEILEYIENLEEEMIRLCKLAIRSRSSDIFADIGRQYEAEEAAKNAPIPDWVIHRHHTEGGTGVTNFSRERLQQFLAAVEEHAHPDLVVVSKPMGPRNIATDFSLHCKTPRDLTAFWDVFNRIKEESKS